MDLKDLLAGLGVFATAAYVYDVLLRPGVACHEARRAAYRRRKPILNVGCGTKRSSLHSFLLGPQLIGDVNMDIEAPHSLCLPDRSCYGDVHRIPYPDKYFGAALAIHVIEHVENPHLALRELHRVADEVFVVVPRWWAPHTWLHPGHRWFISDDLQTMTPLWQ